MDKRILAVDLGTKRVGLAVTDPLNIIAQTFKTIIFKSEKDLAHELKLAIEEKNIGTIVFGVPVTLGGKNSQKTDETIKLIEFLKTKLPEDIIIELEDEAMTTQDAHQVMREMGKKPSKNRDIVDQIAARFILTAYMNRVRK